MKTCKDCEKLSKENLNLLFINNGIMEEYMRLKSYVFQLFSDVEVRIEEIIVRECARSEDKAKDNGCKADNVVELKNRFDV